MKTMLRHHQFGHTEKWAENKFEETVRAPSIPLQRIKEAEIDEVKTFEQLTTTKRQFLFIRDTDQPSKTAQSSASARSTTVISNPPVCRSAVGLTLWNRA